MGPMCSPGPRRELIASVSGGPFRCIGDVTEEDAGRGGACASDRLAAEGHSRLCHRRAGRSLKDLPVLAPNDPSRLGTAAATGIACERLIA